MVPKNMFYMFSNTFFDENIGEIQYIHVLTNKNACMDQSDSFTNHVPMFKCCKY